MRLSVSKASFATENIRRSLWALALLVNLILVDQVTKQMVITSYTGKKHVIGPLYINLSFNKGVAFGFADQFAPLFVAAGLFILAILLFREWDNTTQMLGAVAILAGALSNIGDRVFRDFHAVVDWISVGWWPTFNVADASICCGILVVIWSQRKTLFKK